MHIINTFCNLRQLHHDNDISQSLFQHLYEKMETLQKSLEPDLQDPEKFSLKNHGSLGILQRGDKNLSAIGLPASFDEIMPEWVSHLKVGGKLYYVLYVLADNDYCLQVYLPNKILDKTIRKWIAAQTVEEEPEIQQDNLTPPF